MSLTVYRMATWSYDEGHKFDGRAVHAPELWTVSWSVGGDFGAVSPSCYWNARCRLSLTLASHGRVLSAWWKVGRRRDQWVSSLWLVSNDVGACRAIAHWYESVLRMTSRISGCEVALKVKYLRIVVE